MRALAKPLILAALAVLAASAIATYQLKTSSVPAEPARALEELGMQNPSADAFVRRAEAHAARQRCLAQRLERERVAGCIVGAVLLGILSGGPGVAAVAGCGAGIVLAEADDCQAAPAVRVEAASAD
jgi:hypothetical protein